jgi:hypothetical protein
MKMFASFLSLLIAAFITLPSTAEAWHWSLAYGWDFDSYPECMDYYAANPPVPSPPHYYHFTADSLCAVKKAEEDEERRHQEQITKMIVLTCRETLGHVSSICGLCCRLQGERRLVDW